MKTESEQVQRWDDIIFEKRNKDYGAYTIRKSYGDNVLTGWVISLSVVALVFLCSFLGHDEKPIRPKEACFDCILPTVPPTIIPNQTVTPPPPAPRQVNQNLPPVAVIHPVDDTPPPQVDPPTSGGTEGGTGQPQPGSSDGVSTGAVTPPEPPKPAFYIAPQVMPEFEGGYEGMMQFLQRKLRYPAGPRRKGEEGTVFVSFIVSATGAVTNVELVRGICRDLDQEAMRVVSMMDKWKPGLQDKMPVNVKMVLPIKFKLSS